MADALLEVRDLCRTFGHGRGAVEAVKHASFTIQPGEILAVVGESGSGKTTLARLLLKLIKPSSGDILLRGQNVARLERQAYWRQVQGIFQDPFASFNQFFRVGRVLDQALRLAGGHSSREALASVGMHPDVLDKWPHQFSGGQLQRIMIARALLVQPDLLLADEPTSMLDASLRATILNLLLDLRARHGMGIVLITHDLGQATYLSDRILVMYRGEIVEQGPAEQVLWSPRHTYTQRLLGDVPTLNTGRPLSHA